MSEYIDLSEDDVSRTLRVANDQAGMKKYSANNVREILAAINHVRLGDPVGTVRAKEHYVAIRYADYWNMIDTRSPNGACPSSVTPWEYPIVHTPGGK